MAAEKRAMNLHDCRLIDSKSQQKIYKCGNSKCNNIAVSANKLNCKPSYHNKIKKLFCLKCVVVCRKNNKCFIRNHTNPKFIDAEQLAIPDLKSICPYSFKYQQAISNQANEQKNEEIERDGPGYDHSDTMQYCSWTGPYKKLEEHINNECIYKPIQCEFDGCDCDELMVYNYDIHKQNHVAIHLDIIHQKIKSLERMINEQHNKSNQSHKLNTEHIEKAEKKMLQRYDAHKRNIDDRLEKVLKMHDLKDLYMAQYRNDMEEMLKKNQSHKLNTAHKLIEKADKKMLRRYDAHKRNIDDRLEKMLRKNRRQNIIVISVLLLVIILMFASYHYYTANASNDVSFESMQNIQQFDAPYSDAHNIHYDETSEIQHIATDSNQATMELIENEETFDIWTLMTNILYHSTKIIFSVISNVCSIIMCQMKHQGNYGSKGKIISSVILLMFYYYENQCWILYIILCSIQYFVCIDLVKELGSKHAVKMNGSMSAACLVAYAFYWEYESTFYFTFDIVLAVAHLLFVTVIQHANVVEMRQY